MEKFKTSVFLNQSQYTDEFKMMICTIYLQGDKSKDQIQREFGIKGKSTLLYWLRQLGHLEPIVSFQPNSCFMAKPKKEASRSLEKENEDLKLQVEMYKRMIAMAEKEYKISIEKKPNTK